MYVRYVSQSLYTSYIKRPKVFYFDVCDKTKSKKILKKLMTLMKKTVTMNLWNTNYEEIK